MLAGPRLTGPSATVPAPRCSSLRSPEGRRGSLSGGSARDAYLADGLRVASCGAQHRVREVRGWCGSARSRPGCRAAAAVSFTATGWVTVSLLDRWILPSSSTMRRPEKPEDSVVDVATHETWIRLRLPVSVLVAIARQLTKTADLGGTLVTF